MPAHATQVLYQVFGGHKPEVPDDMPADYRALMEDCWATAPAARPTFPAILERLQPMLTDARTATGPGAPTRPLTAARQPERLG